MSNSVYIYRVMWLKIILIMIIMMGLYILIDDEGVVGCCVNVVFFDDGNDVMD